MIAPCVPIAQGYRCFWEALRGDNNPPSATCSFCSREREVNEVRGRALPHAPSLRVGHAGHAGRAGSEECPAIAERPTDSPPLAFMTCRAPRRTKDTWCPPPPPKHCLGPTAGPW